MWNALISARFTKDYIRFFLIIPKKTKLTIKKKLVWQKNNESKKRWFKDFTPPLFFDSPHPAFFGIRYLNPSWIRLL